MKRLLLIPALLFGSTVMAADYNYEVSPMLGYNFAEGNLGIDNNGYFLGGLELQANSEDSKISPELSIFYAPGVDYSVNGDTNIIRGAFNAVYTYQQNNTLTPFAKVGLGIEQFTDNKAGNEDRLFFDTGVGAKIDFTNNLALKLEALYMLKPSFAHAGNADSNLMTLIGLTYSFGEQAPREKSAPVVVVEHKEVTTVVIVPLAVDSDGDGVVDADDKCANTPNNTTVDITGCSVAQDDDNDGVLNTLDKCPNTPAAVTVDPQGCEINPDLDDDGILNAQDICPDTKPNTAVDENGCPASMTLDIKFENNSYKIKTDSLPNLDKYAAFLKKYPNYSAKIVGYTDSVGAASYNKRLSKKRADEVVKMLEQRGVNPSQLSAKGMGEANPVADNATEAGRAQNRRIEAELVHN